jgi:hypothetical protein
MFVGWPQMWSGYRTLTPPTDRQLALLARVVELHQANGVLFGDLSWRPPRDTSRTARRR